MAVQLNNLKDFPQETYFTMLNEAEVEALKKARTILNSLHGPETRAVLWFDMEPYKGKDYNFSYWDVKAYGKTQTDIEYLWMFYGAARTIMNNDFKHYFSSKKN